MTTYIERKTVPNIGTNIYCSHPAVAEISEYGAGKMYACAPIRNYITIVLKNGDKIGFDGISRSKVTERAEEYLQKLSYIMNTLNEIGVKHGTDKSTITHHYLDNYERYFGPLRDKQLVILEIGVASGASIGMWREYFPNAKVYGIDNNVACAGTGIFIGSQGDKDFLDKVLAETGAPDIIIDDGSHFGPLTIETFRHLFPRMAPAGFYAVEDTHCFYCPTYGEAPPYGQGMSEVYNFFISLAAHVDVFGRAMCGNPEVAINAGIDTPPVPEYSRILESIHLYPSLWIYKRK